MTKRKFSVLFLALLFLFSCACAPEQEASPTGIVAEVLFINVGKADAALVQCGALTFLIDTGTEDSVDAVCSVLEARGIRQLDGVFLTHTHKDHMGGLSGICEKYGVSMLYSARISENRKDGGNKIDDLAEALHLPQTKLNAGDKIEAGEMLFEVLGPLEYNENDDNDNSLVLRLTVEGAVFLFAGDMQFSEEETLLNAGVSLCADVLKVGNHGNPDATGYDFARAVSPRYAVISTDTSVDTDSANFMVLARLGGAKVLLTQDFAAGILFSVHTQGSISQEPYESSH